MEKDAIIIPVTLLVSDDEDNVSSPSSNNTRTEKKQKNNEQPNGANKAETLAKSTANVAKAIVTKVAGQMVSLALSGYGDITGNYVAGANLQTVVKETTNIAAAVSMGPVGIALYAVDKWVQAFRYESEMRKSEMRASFNRQRVYGTTKKS